MGSRILYISLFLIFRCIGRCPLSLGICPPFHRRCHRQARCQRCRRDRSCKRLTVKIRCRYFCRQCYQNDRLYRGLQVFFLLVIQFALTVGTHLNIRNEMAHCRTKFVLIRFSFFLSIRFPTYVHTLRTLLNHLGASWKVTCPHPTLLVSAHTSWVQWPTTLPRGTPLLLRLATFLAGHQSTLRENNEIVRIR